MTADLSTPGTVISFYSYKGGTGRSMAVANTACLLAAREGPKSQRILTVDWDLEAPGLHRFFPARTEQSEHRNRPGIINYFKTLQELLRGNPDLCDQFPKEPGWQVLSRVLPIDDYIIPEVESGVDLIPAGRFDSDYAALVGSFSWFDLYKEFEWAIRGFRELVASKYDYCLIDSRTGLTDISGICTTLLPEKLVTVFTPNSQSQSGVINVIKEAVHYRRASDDLRPLAVFPLPSRIDLAEIELRETWRQNYQKAFEDCFREAYQIEECDLTAYFDEVQLPHVSYYAYGESIAVLREERSEAFSLSRAYQVFKERLVLGHSWESEWERAYWLESDLAKSVALHQLRAPVGDFVGRENEIDTLINNLRHSSRTSITGISGMGGIGKTELALSVAERLSSDYPDAQFFINLQGTDVNPLPPQDALASSIRAFLGPDAKLPEGLDQLTQLYLSLLSGKRVLLVLDNAADTAQVLPLLPPPGSALLITSRQAITLPGMTPLTLDPLTNKEARQLLLEIAPRAGPAADQICALCGYLPLAIRAAGSLLAITVDLDPLKYVAQLKDERNRLERIGGEGVEISVEASFNLSYARLTPEAARVFRMLSVFPGTFDTVAEEVVCADPDHAQLSDLVRRTLVLYHSSTNRYSLHNLTRLFAEAKLSEEERAVAQKRHATHYVEVLAAADNLYLQGGKAVAIGLALVDLEWGNIQTGHTWVAEQGDAANEEVTRLGMAYANAGVYVLDLRQHSREQIRWLEIALAAARRLKHRGGEGAMLGNLGLAYVQLDDIRQAIEFYEQQLTIVREIGDRRGEGNALGNLGNAYAQLGDNQRAIQFNEQRLIIAREIGDRRGESNALGNLGVAYTNLGEIQRAIEFYEQTLLIAREIGDRRGEGNALGNLGNAYAQLGDNRRAIQFYEQQLTIVREIGDRRGQGIGLWNMSLALDQLSARAQAIQYAEQSLAIFEQIEAPNAPKVRALLATLRKETTPS